MLSPKDFLAQECENVDGLLREALRYNYGPRGSKIFYGQCDESVALIKKRADLCRDDDYEAIKGFSFILSELSTLIASVERAHIGEFSWACGEAFRRHAEILCKDDLKASKKPPKLRAAEGAPPPNPDVAGEIAVPLVYFLAEGGTSSYSVTPWNDKLDVSARRVFTITVPRSMRYQVLVHAVITHELGHAFQVVPAHGALVDKLEVLLGTRSALKDMKKVAAWNLEGDLDLKAVIEDGVATEKLLSNWKREIIADLFGLLLMGPGFLGAFRSLFGSLNPLGANHDADHPPDTWRFEALVRAYKHLGWDKIPKSYKRNLKDATTAYTKAMLKFDSTISKADKVFDRGVIEDIMDLLVAQFELLNGDETPTLVYEIPEAEIMGDLFEALINLRPPVGYHIPRGVVADLPVDYRSILHAGWVSLHGKKPERVQEHFDFKKVNGLCEQAIKQRQAIHEWNQGHDDP